MRALLSSISLLGSLLVTGPALATDAVQGLIVELRDAPSHALLARERALASRGSQLAQREAVRWDAVLRQPGALPANLALRARDPVGARAQLLRFERALTRAQAEQIAAALARHPDVATVTLNTRERRMGPAGNPPNDLYFSQQWWLQPVQGSNANTIEYRLRGVPGFQTAWLQREAGSPSAVVAVLDTGKTDHPELTGRWLPGYDFVADSGYANDGDGRDNDPSDPGDWVNAADRMADPGRYAACGIEDSSWHGTVIAGMLAGLTDDGAGVAAMNWYGRVLPVRVAGKCGAEVADIVDGMRWAAGLQVCRRSDGLGGCAEFAPLNPNPARVLNISFGGGAACSPAYQSAIDELRALPNGGAVVVAAAGNEHGGVSRPANCQRAIGVVALNRDGFKSTYSNFGPQIVLATVGGDDNFDPEAKWNALADSGLLSVGNGGLTVPGPHGHYFHWGTSFSTPVAAGAISLMLSVNPALTADQIVQGLRASARPHVVSPVMAACSDANPGRCLCTKATCGEGILDVAQALAFAAAPTAYVPPAQTAAVIDTPELRAAAALGPDRPANPVPPPPSGGGGGGGGAIGAGWLALLLIAARRARRR